MSAQPYIPSDDEISTPKGGGSWRISDGKIRCGRESEGTLIERDKVVGLLRRVGIHKGTGQDGTPIGFLEADIETADGPLLVKVSLLDKAGKLAPGVSALTFAEGLLQIEKDELFIVTAEKGKKQNSYGGYSTYVKLYHLNAETKGTRPTRRGEKDERTILERWQELADKIVKHPAYGVRTSDAEDETTAEPTALELLCQDCKAKGWPTPEQAPEAWLPLMAAFTGKPAQAALSGHTNDEWAAARAELAPKQEMPKALTEAKKRLDEQNALDEHDPFA